MTDGRDGPLGEDEFACMTEVAAELSLPAASIPAVRRVAVQLSAEQSVSVLCWGEGSPEVVYLHGGGQNAHTWDLVALAWGRPALAVDLPGHGRSDRRPDRDYWPVRNADAVRRVLDALAPDQVDLVGMSLGGLTAIRAAAQWPERFRTLTVVDVTPGVGARTMAMSRAQRGTTALIGGPERFDSREEMIDSAVAASPRRPAAAVRRGVVHNTLQLPDGAWAWRYDRMRDPDDDTPLDHTDLWADVSALRVPTMLVRGGESVFVPAEDAAELVRRLPSARVETVPGAGHSVQSDRPRELVDLLRGFVA